MSTIINADTSDGLKFTSDTSGEIKLQSAGTDTVTVDTSGNVGIGTSLPGYTTTNRVVLQVNGTTSSLLGLAYGGTNACYLYGDSSGTTLWSEGSRILTVGTASAGDIEFKTNNTERMRLNSNGKLSIGSNGTGNGVALQIDGSTAPDALMSFKDTRTDGASGVPMCYFQRTTGTIGAITTTTSSTSYNTSSDYRLKDDIALMSGSTERLKQLKPSTWSWKIDGSHGEGFIAHEAQTVVPEAVSGEKDAIQVWKEGEELPEGISVGDNKLDENGNTIPVYQGIDQSKLVPLLTSALQEAITKIEDLETRIQALENA